MSESDQFRQYAQEAPLCVAQAKDVVGDAPGHAAWSAPHLGGVFSERRKRLLQ
jgi:hypothetical protein